MSNGKEQHPAELRQYAYHEAGHYVAYKSLEATFPKALNFRIVEISLHPDSDGLACVLIRFDDEHKWPASMITALLAGIAAEIIAHMKERNYSYKDARPEMLVAAARGIALDHGKGDVEMILRHFDGRTWDFDDLRSALDLVDSNWSRLTRIAERLLVTKLLSAEEAHSLYSEPLD